MGPGAGRRQPGPELRPSLVGRVEVLVADHRCEVAGGASVRGGGYREERERMRPGVGRGHVVTDHAALVGWGQPLQLHRSRQLLRRAPRAPAVGGEHVSHIQLARRAAVRYRVVVVAES